MNTPDRAEIRPDVQHTSRVPRWLRQPVFVRLLFATLVGSAGAPTLVEVFQALSGNTPTAEAAGCKIKVAVLGYHYMDNPVAPATRGLIDPDDFVLPPVKFGDAVVFFDRQEIARSTMVPRGDHEETVFELDQNPNARGSDQSPALRIEIGFTEDKIKQGDGRPVTKAITVRCGRFGWFYGGRIAIDKTIEQIAETGRFAVRKAGTAVDEATKRIFGAAAGIAPKVDDPKQNLKDVRDFLEQAKQASQEAKKEEREKAQVQTSATATSTPAPDKGRIPTPVESGQGNWFGERASNIGSIANVARQGVTERPVGIAALVAVAAALLYRRWGPRHIVIRNRRII